MTVNEFIAYAHTILNATSYSAELRREQHDRVNVLISETTAHLRPRSASGSILYLLQHDRIEDALACYSYCIAFIDGGWSSTYTDAGLLKLEADIENTKAVEDAKTNIY